MRTNHSSDSLLPLDVRTPPPSAAWAPVPPWSWTQGGRSSEGTAGQILSKQKPIYLFPKIFLYGLVIFYVELKIEDL